MRATANRQQQVRSADLWSAGRAVQMRNGLLTLLGETDAFRIQADVDVFAGQDFLDRHRYILVLALNQAGPHLDDSDLASKSAEHLPELQPHVAAAHYDQMLGKKVDFHHRAVGEIFDLFESGHWRHGRAAADVDEDPIGRYPVLAHTNLSGRLETGVALVDCTVFHPLQPRLDTNPRLPGYGVLPRLDAPHVDPHAAIDRHPEVDGTARHMGGIGARHHGLGRYAAGIHTRAAEQFALDDRNFHVCRSQALGEERPCLACANNDRVEFISHENRETIQTAPADRDCILDQSDRKICYPIATACPF